MSENIIYKVYNKTKDDYMLVHNSHYDTRSEYWARLTRYLYSKVPGNNDEYVVHKFQIEEHRVEYVEPE